METPINLSVRVLRRTITLILLALAIFSAVPRSSAACLPLPAGAVAWWRLDGNATDSVGTNAGVILGNAPFASGEVNQSLNFDGTDDEVDIAPSPSLNVGKGAGFTIELWINPASVSFQQPLIEWNDRHDYVGLHLWLAVPQPYGGGPGSLWANLIDVSNTAHWFPSVGGIVASNQWSHIALTYDKASGTTVLYCNGTNIAEQNFGQITVETSLELFLGRRVSISGSNDRYQGNLDEASLYNRALSAAEVQSIFKAGGSGKCTNPVGPTYDLSRDFSVASNPNGVWSYGAESSIGGTFSLLPFPQTVNIQPGLASESWLWANSVQPIISHYVGTTTWTNSGGLGIFPPGTVTSDSGTDDSTQNFAVIRFTVPAGGAGSYQLQTSVHSKYDESLSRDSDFHVTLNGTEIFGQFLPPNSGTGYTNTLVLAVGDTIDLLVGRGADGTQYASGLKIQASLNLIQPSAVTYDLSRDFSVASNPNGVWSYGAESSIGGTFSLLPFPQTVNIQPGLASESWLWANSVQPIISHYVMPQA